MQQRRGTAAEWTTVNPILAAGEIGFETDTGKFKIGDGTNAWADLTSYGTLDSVIDAAPGTLDTLNELAAAINDDPEFYTSISTSITVAVDQLNTSIAGAIQYADDAVAAEVADRGAADDAISATVAGVQTSLSALEASVDTINTGLNDELTARQAGDASLAGDIETETAARIAADSDLQAAIDAEALARQSDISTTRDYADQAEADAISTAALDATAKADAAQTAAELTASNALDAHNLETLNVHGIADTGALATSTDVSNALASAQTYADGLAVNYDAAGAATAAQTAAEGYADGAVSTHAAVTTNVHGIADTSDLALLSANTQTFSGDMVISGSLTVEGTTTTVSATDLVVTDPLIYIGEGNSGNAVDLGIVSSFNDGTYQHAGIVRDASDSKWKLFKGVTDEPTTTINFAQGSLDDLAVNNVEVVGVVFSDGTQTKVGVPSITTITEKTASYELASLAERDTIVEVNSQGATTLTIPSDSSVNFPVGTTLDVIQTGTGQVTIAGAQGVTVNATPGLKLRAQWSSVTLLKRGANSWVVFGDTAA
jgi:hypothetical protein